MSWLARLRAWFAGEGSPPARTPRAGRPGGRGRSGRAAALDGDLEAFLASRRGVEAYLEPRTTMSPASVLLVAGDGEYLRRPLADRAALERRCRERGVPVYDATRVGYPRRLQDFERGRPSRPVDLTELPPWPGDDLRPPDAPAPPPA